MRSLTPQMRADFTTYQRLAAHEEQFTETAAAAGRRDAAALARRVAARYRADAFALLAKLYRVMLWEAWHDQEHHARRLAGWRQRTNRPITRYRGRLARGGPSRVSFVANLPSSGNVGGLRRSCRLWCRPRAHGERTGALPPGACLFGVRGTVDRAKYGGFPCSSALSARSLRVVTVPGVC
jgi:hypothetical protein